MSIRNRIAIGGCFINIVISTLILATGIKILTFSPEYIWSLLMTAGPLTSLIYLLVPVNE